MIDVSKSIREIAIEQTSSIRVFERFGINYCCKGRVPLTQACAARGISLDTVIAELNAAADEPGTRRSNWMQAPLRQLIEHMVKTHHAYLRTELPRLSALAEKVARRHGDKQLHLFALQDVLAQLSSELAQHLAKEQNVLFPYIVKVEDAISAGRHAPHAGFGTVANPIADLAGEHDNTCEVLAALGRLSDNYTPPGDAGQTYRAFYKGLKDLEQNVHQHIHLESNILFPRAIELEARRMPWPETTLKPAAGPSFPVRVSAQA